MKTLNAFLNPVKSVNTQFVVSERFVEDGKAVPWELKVLSSAEGEIALRQAYINGQIDDISQRYEYAARCVVYPDLTDAELLKAYGVLKPSDLLRQMLTDTEFARLLVKCYEINGATMNMQELVDEAKN
ncbi:phage tail assembly chaperone [Acetanaerobacterium elongatum]|uniref:Phage XkdN-like tail assembly chaperone protein, TAC n=1 Tax=Acetanaerobacterium elongatum TaxID=258515 RepID=A0A1G9Z1R9_9FIRM|nr:phage portal protein [Acetanaerobacterium elongatum]SDN15289.1 Phage XkdN-like tail assembly chaperone protein, TAC [Acetanaerobacterium elongatum]